MFETLESIREQKSVSSLYTRIFFGSYALGGAALAILDFQRHGLHRPVLLFLQVLTCIVAVRCFQNSWLGTPQEKFNKQAIFVMILFLLQQFVHDVRYT